jgi:hypothetical protein
MFVKGYDVLISFPYVGSCFLHSSTITPQLLDQHLHGGQVMALTY